METAKLGQSRPAIEVNMIIPQTAIKQYDDADQFFGASEEITEAEVNFDWSLAVERRELLRRFRKLTVLSFGPSSKIETCEAVDEIPSLTAVRLVGQHRLKDFSALAKLPQLTELKVTAAWQLDLKPLGEMRNLEKLLLESPSKGYKVINNLEKLTDLSIGFLKIKNLKHISNLHRLCRLDVRANPLSTLEGIPKTAPIEYLNASQTSIDSVEPLSSLFNLKVLWITRCRNLKDIKPISKVKSLREIFLNDNRNELDLSPLAGCPNLEILFFYGTEVTLDSLKALKEMKSLKRCEFTIMREDLPYSVEQIQSFAPGCKFRILLPDKKLYSTPV